MGQPMYDEYHHVDSPLMYGGSNPSQAQPEEAYGHKEFAPGSNGQDAGVLHTGSGVHPAQQGGALPVGKVSRVAQPGAYPKGVTPEGRSAFDAARRDEEQHPFPPSGSPSGKGSTVASKVYTEPMGKSNGMASSSKPPSGGSSPMSDSPGPTNLPDINVSAEANSWQNKKVATAPGGGTETYQAQDNTGQSGTPMKFGALPPSDQADPGSPNYNPVAAQVYKSEADKASAMDNETRGIQAQNVADAKGSPSNAKKFVSGKAMPSNTNLAPENIGR